MREAFVRYFMNLAERDSRVMLLTADLGFMVVEPVARAFPNRFINVGVAEQNMMGIATGLADAGLIPFCYSIATFAVLRPYEFIRNGPVAHCLPVRIVGIGGGFDYGPAGGTHHALEDIALMRALPGMTVLAPADPEQTAAALAATWNLPGPVYYRLGKGNRPVAGLDGRFSLGRAQKIREGSDLLIFVTGGIASEALKAAGALADKGIESAVVVVASLQPAPCGDIADEIANAPAVLTMEAHRPNGGLGSLVAEIMAEAGLSRRFRRLAAGNKDDGRSGSADWLNARHGLSSAGVVDAALALLAGKAA
jgi:transketolase